MKKIYLIDGNSFIYRMFYAIPEFSTSSGVPVNAVFGIAKLFLGQMTQEKPDIIVFVQDAKGDNFRHALYEDYKATRDRMPDQLREQIPLIEDMLERMGFSILQKSGYEADDVIATLATQLQKDEKNEIFILSGDKDLFALVGKNVKIYDTMKKKIYDEDATKVKFEVPACSVTDYLAIVGDTSDNIPGISGFGPKKAIALLGQYGTLENIYEHIADADFPLSEKLRNALADQKEIAFLSKKLATLEKNVPLEDFYLTQFSFTPESLHTPRVQEFFERYEFKSLQNKKPEKKQTWNDLGKTVQIVSDSVGLQKLQKEIFQTTEILLTTQTRTEDIYSELLWVGISCEEREYYINISHDDSMLSESEIWAFFREIFASDIRIIGHDVKRDLHALARFLQ